MFTVDYCMINQLKYLFISQIKIDNYLKKDFRLKLE